MFFILFQSPSIREISLLSYSIASDCGFIVIRQLKFISQYQIAMMTVTIKAVRCLAFVGNDDHERLPLLCWLALGRNGWTTGDAKYRPEYLKQQVSLKVQIRYIWVDPTFLRFGRPDQFRSVVLIQPLDHAKCLEKSDSLVQV